MSVTICDSDPHSCRSPAGASVCRTSDAAIGIAESCWSIVQGLAHWRLNGPALHSTPPHSTPLTFHSSLFTCTIEIEIDWRFDGLRTKNTKSQINQTPKKSPKYAKGKIEATRGSSKQCHYIHGDRRGPFGLTQTGNGKSSLGFYFLFF